MRIRRAAAAHPGGSKARLRDGRPPFGAGRLRPAGLAAARVDLWPTPWPPQVPLPSTATLSRAALSPAGRSRCPPGRPDSESTCANTGTRGACLEAIALPRRRTSGRVRCRPRRPGRQ